LAQRDPWSHRCAILAAGWTIDAPMSTIADASTAEPAVRATGRTRVAVLGSPTRTSDDLVAAWLAAGMDVSVTTPVLALASLEAGDVALLRLDVLPTLDGIEPGFDVVPILEERGVRVLNRPQALLAAHDKLLTADALAAAGLRQTHTAHVRTTHRCPQQALPCVVKPRFGSWGADVMLCKTTDDLDRALAIASSRPWWARHGALVQELVPPTGRDLRLLVAGGKVVGAAARVAATGEWRTNVSVGGHLERAEPPPQAIAEAERAARALEIDLAGVDLLPWDGGWVVLEVNGAIDFDERYTIPGREMYREIAGALGLPLGPARDFEDTRAAAPASPARGLPAEVGDQIEIRGQIVGGRPRRAEILEVRGEPGHEHFRVRWEDDGHESIYFLAEDAVIRGPEP
jgi:RimK family alpha-L-glutamate ligase